MASASPDPVESGGEGAGGGEGTDQAEADRAFEVRRDLVLNLAQKLNAKRWINLTVTII